MDPVTQNPEIQEALRRRAMLGGSSSGIGAEQANAPTSPIAEMGQQPPQGGAEGFPTDGAMGALPKQQDGEAKLILKALSKRLNTLPPTQ